MGRFGCDVYFRSEMARTMTKQKMKYGRNCRMTQPSWELEHSTSNFMTALLVSPLQYAANKRVNYNETCAPFSRIDMYIHLHGFEQPSSAIERLGWKAVMAEYNLHFFHRTRISQKVNGIKNINRKIVPRVVIKYCECFYPSSFLTALARTAPRFICV